MKRRILSIITALALCLSLCPTWAFAVEGEPDTGLCDHHPEHTEDCGYTAPTEGQPCGHEHTAECYTLGVLPDADGGNPYEVGGDTENLLDCHHSHDSECGYVEADPGAPCGYECRICPIEDLIAALPEQVTEDNRADVEAQLQEILGLFSDLTEEEQEEINLSRIYALQGALDEANNPMPLAGAVEYVDAAGNAQQSPADCVTITADMANKNLTGGWYVAEGNVTINGALNFNGETHLILADGCKLTVNNNLQTTNLTIYGQTNGTGFLCAGNNSLRAPAIGALTSKVAITINGGCVQAMSLTIVVGTAPYYVIGGLDGSTVTINGGVAAAHDYSGQKRHFPQNFMANGSRGCIVARNGVGEVYGSMTLAETSGSGITLSSLHISKGASLNSPGRWKSISITMEDLPADNQFNIMLKWLIISKKP